jgi:hypothetical protein
MKFNRNRIFFSVTYQTKKHTWKSPVDCPFSAERNFEKAYRVLSGVSWISGTIGSRFTESYLQPSGRT